MRIAILGTCLLASTFGCGQRQTDEDLVARGAAEQCLRQVEDLKYEVDELREKLKKHERHDH